MRAVSVAVAVAVALVLVLLIPSSASADRLAALAEIDLWWKPDGQRGLRTAVGLMEDHPTWLPAHVEYIRRQGWAPAVKEQYRRWLQESPQDPVRRQAVAATYVYPPLDVRVPCREVEELFSTPSDDPTHRWYAAYHRELLRGRCYFDDDLPPRAALADLEAVPGVTTRLQWILRLKNGPVTPSVRKELREHLARFPWELSAAEWLWSDGARGSALSSARRDTLKAARAALESEHGPTVDGARGVFDAAGAPKGLEAAWARLDALGVGYTPPPTVAYEEINAVFDGRSGTGRPTPDEVEAGVARLAAEYGEVGESRAHLELRRADYHDEAGRSESAHEAWAAAWRARPSSHYFATRLARSSVELGKNLETAREALSHVLGDSLEANAGDVLEPHRYSPGMSYEDWMARGGETHARLLSLRGWVLHHMGRSEEATGDLKRSLLIRPTAETHLRLGFALDALGRDDEALEAFLNGLTLGGADPDLDRRVRGAVAPRLKRAGIWAPHGLEGYIEARRASR